MSRSESFDELASLAYEFTEQAENIRDYLESGINPERLISQFQRLERIADELAKATAEAVS